MSSFRSGMAAGVRTRQPETTMQQHQPGPHDDEADEPLGPATLPTPTCLHCNLQMHWYYSRLERQNGSEVIAHSFYCDNCSAVSTVRQPMKPHYEFLVA